MKPVKHLSRRQNVPPSPYRARLELLHIIRGRLHARAPPQLQSIHQLCGHRQRGMAFQRL